MLLVISSFVFQTQLLKKLSPVCSNGWMDEICAIITVPNFKLEHFPDAIIRETVSSVLLYKDTSYTNEDFCLFPPSLMVTSATLHRALLSVNTSFKTKEAQQDHSFTINNTR